MYEFTHTDIQTEIDTDRDIVASAMKQIATKSKMPKGDAFASECGIGMNCEVIVKCDI